MRLGNFWYLLSTFCLAGLLSAGFIQAAPADNLADQQTAQHGGMEDVIIEDFENAEDWRAKATCPLGETKLLKQIQMGEMFDVYDPNIKPPPEKSKPMENHILGVKTRFCNKGFDRVEIAPPHEYALKGKPRQFSVWVLGRKFDHTLYIKLRDYRGKLHKLRLGRLNFFGWRRLNLTIPGWLPQSVRYSWLDKKLHFVSLYVVAGNHEVAGDYYLYVDNLRVKTDTSSSKYPGSEIKDNW